jgi:hypothetical protein
VGGGSNEGGERMSADCGLVDVDSSNDGLSEAGGVVWRRVGVVEDTEDEVSEQGDGVEV